jgi:hypothetical protein
MLVVRRAARSDVPVDALSSVLDVEREQFRE